MSLKTEIENIVRNVPLYLMCRNVDSFKATNNPHFKGLPKDECYELGPKKNYKINESEGIKAITEFSNSVKIYLEDLLLDGTTPLEGTSSNYDIEITIVTEETGRVKIEGILKNQIEFILSNTRPCYTGKHFSGYVKEIKKGPSKDKIAYPDFDF